MRNSTAAIEAQENQPPMKALTLTQPWATFVALKVKRWETRSWATKYRGPLAIHAAKRYPGDAKTFAFEMFYGALRDPHHPPDPNHPLLAVGFAEALVIAQNLPCGAVLATCTLVDCIPSEQAKPSPAEKLLGDYSPGRSILILDDVVQLKEPVLTRGALGLWEWNRAAS